MREKVYESRFTHYESRFTNHVSLHPISDKDIRIALDLVVSVGREHKFLSIRAEHRKAIKSRIEGDALQAGAVDVDRVEIKVAALWIVHVRREDYSLAVRKEVGCKVGFAVASHLALAGAVRLHHPYLERSWPDQIVFQKRKIIGLILFGLRVICTEYDPLAVVRPERAAVVTDLICKPLNVLSVDVHRVDVQVAVSR